jgi:hypothetical protein
MVLKEAETFFLDLSLDPHPRLSAALMSARGFVGDGPINLLRARDEVHATLRAAGGKVPSSAVCADALAPLRVPSVAAGLSHDRVLAEIDQDGFAFATDPLDEAFFNRRADRRERQQNLLDIVLFEGRVCVRKRFRALRKGALRWGSHSVPPSQRLARAVWTTLRLFLYSEAAALLRLHDLPFVPKLRHIDLIDNAIYVDFLDGESLRHRAAKTGAPVHDKDLAEEDGIAGMTARQLDRREVDLLERTSPGNFRQEIAAMVAQINHRGVAPLDIKLGNFIRGSGTGRLYWLDFEICRLETQPRWEADLGVQNEILDALFAEARARREQRSA